MLPCLPDAWAGGELRGVRCRGGFEVDLAWADGRLTEARVTSLRGEACRVEYGEGAVVLGLEAGECCDVSEGLGHAG